MERKISRKGFLFRYAYWFTPKGLRPTTVNLCPFFWRLVFTTFVKMPLWWLVWAPLAFFFGFFFAARPRVFESDGCSTNDEGAALLQYQHWPKVSGTNIWPAPLLLGGIFLGVIRMAWISAAGCMIGSHSLLFWGLSTIGGLLLAILVFGLFLAAKEDWLPKQEWYRLAADRAKAKKEGICPSYEVVD